MDLGEGIYVASIALGYGHTCVILESDALKCWGWNFYGQLGDSTLVASLLLLRNDNTALLNALADSVEINIFSPNDNILKPGEQIHRQSWSLGVTLKHPLTLRSGIHRPGTLKASTQSLE